MAHFKKFKGSNAYIEIDHDDRSNTDTKENIDHSRTYLNYNLCNVKNAKEYLNKWIRKAKESGATIRDDTNLICSLIVTLPENFPKNEELKKQFFKAAVELIAEDFGKDRIVSAWVHCDECKKNTNRPNKEHIHIKFAPVREKIKKYKNETEKTILSFDAKNCVNLNYLKQFHKRLEAYIEDYIGFKAEVINGKTKTGNKTIEELKEISEAKKAAEQVLKMTPRELAEMKKEQNEFKEHRAELWEDYKENSQIYWSWYKTEKQKINNQLWEISKGVKQAEKDLERSLDLFSNMSQGFLYAIFSFIGAIFKKIHKDRLKADQERLKGILEEMNKQRRTISNHQHNTKEALKREDLEKVEILLEQWEQALNKTHMNMKASMEMKTGLFEQHREETALQVDFDMIK